MFNWAGLPTELKELVLQHCVYRPHSEQYQYRVRVYRPRHNPGPREVIDKLGDWEALLRLSSQTRILALRTVLAPRDRYPGLVLACDSMREFREVIWRLGQYYQIFEPNSVPIDQYTEYLAKLYLHYPKQYPHLSRFATMRHGIRKIYLKLNFMDAMNFWKVIVGGFDQYPRPFKHQIITCDVLEKLPNLDGLHIALPSMWWKDQVKQPGPRLFRETEACPRTLHRFIYERIAQVLAPYKDVSVTMFMDIHEEQRFWNHYETAVQSLKFSKQELKELYEEDGGGIALDNELDIHCEASTQMNSSISDSYMCVNQSDFNITMSIINETFPPRCYCTTPCQDAFFEIG